MKGLFVDIRRSTIEAAKSVQAAVFCFGNHARIVLCEIFVRHRRAALQANSRLLVILVTSSGSEPKFSCTESVLERADGTRACHYSHGAHLGAAKSGVGHSPLFPPQERASRAIVAATAPLQGMPFHRIGTAQSLHSRCAMCRAGAHLLKQGPHSRMLLA